MSHKAVRAERPAHILLATCCEQANAAPLVTFAVVEADELPRWHLIIDAGAQMNRFGGGLAACPCCGAFLPGAAGRMAAAIVAARLLQRPVQPEAVEALGLLAPTRAYRGGRADLDRHLRDSLRVEPPDPAAPFVVEAGE